MKIGINIEWWENEGQERIPEEHINELTEHAIDRAKTMIKEGYCAGEIHHVIENGE